MMKTLKFYNAKMRLDQLKFSICFIQKLFLKNIDHLQYNYRFERQCATILRNKLGQTKQISFKHFKLKWKCSFNVLCLFINTVSKTLHAAEWRHAGSYIPNQPHSCFLNHKTDNCPTLTKDIAWLMRAGTSSCASGRHAV